MVWSLVADMTGWRKGTVCFMSRGSTVVRPGVQRSTACHWPCLLSQLYGLDHYFALRFPLPHLMSKIGVTIVPAPTWSCWRVKRGQTCQAFATVWACSEGWLLSHLLWSWAKQASLWDRGNRLREGPGLPGATQYRLFPYRLHSALPNSVQ